MIVVVDSWAVIRYLEDQGSAAQEMTNLLAKTRPLMSWIHLGEVHYILRREFGASEAAETIGDLKQVLDIRLPDERQVLDASSIKADHPMAYAEAFGAALAIVHRAELWTGDPELLLEGSS